MEAIEKEKLRVIIAGLLLGLLPGGMTLLFLQLAIKQDKGCMLYNNKITMGCLLPTISVVSYFFIRGHVLGDFFELISVVMLLFMYISCTYTDSVTGLIYSAIPISTLWVLFSCSLLLSIRRRRASIVPGEALLVLAISVILLACGLARADCIMSICTYLSLSMVYQEKSYNHTIAFLLISHLGAIFIELLRGLKRRSWRERFPFTAYLYFGTLISFLPFWS